MEGLQGDGVAAVGFRWPSPMYLNHQHKRGRIFTSFPLRASVEQPTAEGMKPPPQHLPHGARSIGWRPRRSSVQLRICWIAFF